MPTPTEEGWFWWRACDDVPEECRKVFACGGLGGVMAVFPAGTTLGTLASPVTEVGGTWGERIPGTDRLKAMGEMADVDPRTLLPSDDTEYDGCFFCKVKAGADGSIDHPPDCLWLRAQEHPDA